MNAKDIIQVKSGIPPIIYLQWFGDEKDPQPDPDWHVVVSEVSWSLERIFDADIEYVRANALPAVEAQLTEAVELLRRLTSTSPLMHHRAGIEARAFLAKVDAL